MFGNSGMCSWNHNEGMIAPKAATAHHAIVIQGRFLIQCLDTSLHLAIRKTAIVMTLDNTVVTMSPMALSEAPFPLINIHEAFTIMPAPI